MARVLDVEQAQSPAGEAALRIVVEEACRGAELLDEVPEVDHLHGRAIRSGRRPRRQAERRRSCAPSLSSATRSRDFLASNSLRSPATPWSKLTAPSSGIAPYRIVQGVAVLVVQGDGRRPCHPPRDRDRSLRCALLGRPGGRGRGSAIGSETRSTLALTLRASDGCVGGDQRVLDLDLARGVQLADVVGDPLEARLRVRQPGPSRAAPVLPSRGVPR
ncbi:MAG: hypothetical protein HS111_11635 [Kofleriaceae bacterium]|nr:hypothetical protein [Kofleriaceae bacterium]